MSEFESNAIFWIDVQKIHPNPYQPRREFDPDRLSELAESIRQYGLLQPITVTRKEEIVEGKGITVTYELIAGERRTRASKLAGLTQIPAIIRTGQDNARMKLELAIIENLQREDLNAMDRARAFKQLAEEFGFKHSEIGKKIGRSREYVSNSIRLLSLPEVMQQALVNKRINEGHTRPLMMLNDRPEEQDTLYKEIVYKKLTVREAESIARRVAQDKVRKIERKVDPEIIELEKELSESFGTRVQIHSKEVGGKVIIDFFSNDDLKNILIMLNDPESAQEALESIVQNAQIGQDTDEPEPKTEADPAKITFITFPFSTDISYFIKLIQAERAEASAALDDDANDGVEEEAMLEDTSPSTVEVELPDDTIAITPSTEDKDDLYSIRNFSL